MSEIEIYEIDTGYFNVDVPKGNTIVKVVLLEDYNKKIAEAKREALDKLDEAGRLIIMRLKHDPGSPKGRMWCDGYHEGLADMLIELKKHLEGNQEDELEM